MMEYKASGEGDLVNKEGFSVRVLGIGGAGANALDRIALEGMDGAEMVAMNTDVRALTTSVATTKIQLGKELTRGLGSGGDPELGREAAVEVADEIRKSLKGQSLVFICVGLGGGTGSGAAPVVARLAEQAGAFVVVFATFPFSFEGRRRLEQAQAALNELNACANAVIVFENDRMGELTLAKEGIQKAFAAADKIISQSVRAVTQLVTKAGLIHIGLDDLISALRNTDSRCLFGSGRGNGQNRAQAAVNEALKSALLDRGQLAQARNVLVHICGGESMTLYEVELLMAELGKSLRGDAQIFFGTGTDAAMGEDIGVTIISSLDKSALKGAPKAVVAGKSEGGGKEKEEEAPAGEKAPEKEGAEPEAAKPEVGKPAPAEQKEAEGAEEFLSGEEEEFVKEVMVEGADNNGGGAEASEGDKGSSEGEKKAAEPEPEEAVAATASASRTGASQAELKLNPGARGRFEQTEPTIVDGEDLDVPTFLREKD